MRTLVTSLVSILKGTSGRRHLRRMAPLTHPPECEAFQRYYLTALVSHAFQHCPYYTHILAQAGVVSPRGVDLANWHRVPVLTKDILRHTDGLVADDSARRHWHFNASGGSTGEPVRYRQDHEYVRWRNATVAYFYQAMIGLSEQRCREVVFWASERDLLHGTGMTRAIMHWLTRTSFLNTLRMSAHDMDAYASALIRIRPDVVRGYSSSLFQMARHIQSHRITIPSPRAVICTADMLTPEMRETIQQAFGTRAHNFYGSREVGSIAGECRHGQLHILGFHNHVEILSNHSDRQAEPGEAGRVVVTNLHNLVMPFIRFDTGDMAIADTHACPCGSPLPTLGHLTGRVTEHLLTTQGELVSGTGLTLTFNGMAWVRAFKILQVGPRHVILYVVPDGAIDPQDQQAVTTMLTAIMGTDCRIEWAWVDHIPRTRGGKHLYIERQPF